MKLLSPVSEQRDIIFEESAEVIANVRHEGDQFILRLRAPKTAVHALPGQFAANAVFFRIGVLAYNLFVMFRTHALPEAWGRHQVRTIRWRLYQIAGRITRHARFLWLKVSDAHIALFRDIRRRCSQLACA